MFLCIVFAQNCLIKLNLISLTDALVSTLKVPGTSQNVHFSDPLHGSWSKASTPQLWPPLCAITIDRCAGSSTWVHAKSTHVLNAIFPATFPPTTNHDPLWFVIPTHVTCTDGQAPSRTSLISLSSDAGFFVLLARTGRSSRQIYDLIPKRKPWRAASSRTLWRWLMSDVIP